MLMLLLSPFVVSAQISPHPTTTGKEGIPLWELVAKATAVFEGKALAYRTFWNQRHTHLYTVATVEVYKVFKGQVAGIVEVSTLGGVTSDGAMGMVEGAVPIGNHVVGMFFAAPMQEDAANKPAVPAGQCYQVVGGHEGLFVYNGIPPEQNAADTPYLRYFNIENSLYPLLQKYTGGVYREFKPFNVNKYNKILERRGVDSQFQDGAASKNVGSRKTRLVKIRK